MDTPLNASSTTAGALIGGGRFNVPEFQREYAWGADEINEFFGDLSGALGDETYFLGLVIVTGDQTVKDVVDGQQRILTLTLLASAVYHEAIRYERHALADRIQTTFLRSIDFGTDEETPRVTLSSPRDDAALQQILASPARDLPQADSTHGVASYLVSAYKRISDKLLEDLKDDPFRRLGSWAEFLTAKLYFAVFVHPDPASAYRVFEIINTRGRELTTADLLKSYVLSQTPPQFRPERYEQWQSVSEAFLEDGQSTFVQFIRHAVTVQRGHVAPRDLYDVLTGKRRSDDAMSPADLMAVLEHHLPLYLQIADPTVIGRASSDELGVFSMLNALNVISVRPILLALADTPDSTEGMLHLLRLVMQRIVTGTLGTGNVERRFGVTAQRIAQEGRWQAALAGLNDLRPQPHDFEQRAAERSLNRNVLGAIRASVLQGTIIPELEGSVYFIKPRNAEWSAEDEDRASYWASTLGNTFISTETRRPMGSSTWDGFKRELLPLGIDAERKDQYRAESDWGVEQIIEFGKELAAEARELWYE
ncbi:hypothetical protein DEI81_08555 [Curtobacterium sp. MCBD17_013]|uniref:DUF262 domain-containing protein n=1 Tax=Curtobacterium sp. MCBD17_013 TaxID=2175668 RepID=UPI000DA77F4A|nr:DUF262 domain-containing protein [Curtobacterium sp. MCBD17_013]PZF62994.1 hypothetical protein DEI81_08555 [Curtobacterium sp. MCBD17_013]